MKENVADTIYHQFPWYCCVGGPFEMSINLPKNGWAPGEAIPVILNINNKSKIEGKFVQMKLIEKLTFVANQTWNERHVEIKTLKEQKMHTQIRARHARVIQFEFFLDPNHDWKVINNSKIIHAEYFIVAEIGTPWYCNNHSQSTKINLILEPLTIDMSKSLFNPNKLTTMKTSSKTITLDASKLKHLKVPK